MATGDVTLTNLGEYPVSGSSLLTAISAQTGITHDGISGARLIYLPVAGGNRVQVYKEVTAAT